MRPHRKILPLHDYVILYLYQHLHQHLHQDYLHVNVMDLRENASTQHLRQRRLCVPQCRRVLLVHPLGSPHWYESLIRGAIYHRLHH